MELEITLKIQAVYRYFISNNKLKKLIFNIRIYNIQGVESIICVEKNQVSLYANCQKFYHAFSKADSGK